MTDETREQLSAYLDGALPEAERAELQARLAASAELRGALEDLKSVSSAVKNLPKAPLPSGFMARLSARRARGDAPRTDWVFLPPEVRPVVAAMSCGVVALAIWNKVAVPPEVKPVHAVGYAPVYDKASAPVSQVDLAKPGAAADLGIAGAEAGARVGQQTSKVNVDSLSSLQETAPASDMKRVGSIAAVRGGSGGRAPGQPIDGGTSAGASELALTDRSRTTMTEEERSARNEELFGALEKQKKAMGLRVLPRRARPSGPSIASMMGLPEPRAIPAAPVVLSAAPSLLKSNAGGGPASSDAALSAAAPAPGSGPGRLSPDAGLVFTDAHSLASSWVLLGLPGDPPETDFTSGRLVMIKPSATKILSVTPGPDAVVVVYRSLQPEETSDPARDRVAPLPSQPRTVLIYDASPR
jgi:hypothetical protein